MYLKYISRCSAGKYLCLNVHVLNVNISGFPPENLLSPLVGAQSISVLS